MTRRVRLHDLGLVPYGQALQAQLELRAQLQAHALSEASSELGSLLCLEHPTTLTLGRRGKVQDIIGRDLARARGVPVFQVDRGGEATCHEPGQLVLYPVLRLEPLGMGVVDLIRALAQALAQTLSDYGLEADYDPKTPGLWTRQTPPHKVASVGMRVSGGVTTHGLAVNVVNDLSGFGLIVPCGMPEAPMTTLARHLGPEAAQALTVSAFKAALLPKLEQALRAELIPAPLTLPSPPRWIEPMAWEQAAR